MGEKMRKIIKSALFVIIGLMLFVCVQNIMIPDHPDVEDQEQTMDGFAALGKDSVDVLIVGASTMSYGLLPMELYENYQIQAYNLSSSGQPTECSYYLAKYAFERQSPKVVVLDVGPIIQSDNHFSDSRKNFFWWNLFNHLPMGKVKWEMAMAFNQMPYSDGAASVILPIMKYHSRWNQLNKDDFTWPDKSLFFAGGAFIQPAWYNSGITKEDMLYEEQDILARSDGEITFFDGTQIETERIDEPIYSPIFTDEKRQYLLKFKQLCEENGAQLVLLKIPSFYHINTDPWTPEKAKLIRDFADKNSIPFYDYSLDYNLVDPTTDFCDGGPHVNVRGGIKVSEVFGAVLRDEFQCLPTQNEEFDRMLADYKKVIDAALLETETNFYSYIERLGERKDDYTIYIVANNEYTLNMMQEDYDFIKEKLGLQLISQGGYTDSYMAVIDSGKLSYEAVSNRRIDHSMVIDGMDISLSSSGWYSGPESSVEIEGVNYALDSRGLTVVVFDNESGVVIDSVVFDTFQTEKPVYRSNTLTLSLLREYESRVCFD